MEGKSINTKGESWDVNKKQKESETYSKGKKGHKQIPIECFKLVYSIRKEK